MSIKLLNRNSSVCLKSRMEVVVFLEGEDEFGEVGLVVCYFECDRN